MRLILLAALAGPVAFLAACAPPDDGRPPAVLPFIADDYATALAEARERKLPIFIESWAPW